MKSSGLTPGGARLAIVHHRDYHAPLVQGHRFPMGKFRRLAEVLAETGVVGPRGFVEPIEAPMGWLCLAHDPAYVAAVLGRALDAAAQRRIGFPVDAAVVRRARLATSGTVLAARLALEHGLACNTAGGSHHAGFGHGAGFCVFNDVAVAARVLLAEGAIARALVVDLDVHQGDGTARIFAADERVFTFSMHGARNFPVRKARSDLDIELADGTGDDDYLAALGEILPGLIERVRPGIVFYNAGVDVHAEDRLGRLALSDEGIARREAYVFECCRVRGVPVAGVIGGGYGPDIDTLARRHAIMHRTASAVFEREGVPA